MRDIQKNLFEHSKRFCDAHVRTADTYAEFRTLIEGPGFVWAHSDGTRATRVGRAGVIGRGSDVRGRRVGHVNLARMAR